MKFKIVLLKFDLSSVYGFIVAFKLNVFEEDVWVGRAQIGINPKRLEHGEIGRKRGVTFDANNNSVKMSAADEVKRDERTVQPSYLHFICMGN